MANHPTPTQAAAEPTVSSTGLICGGGITIEDLRKMGELVKAWPKYKIVRVSDEWAVLLKDGKPESSIEWKLMPHLMKKELMANTGG